MRGKICVCGVQGGVEGGYYTLRRGCLWGSRVCSDGRLHPAEGLCWGVHVAFTDGRAIRLQRGCVYGLRVFTDEESYTHCGGVVLVEFMWCSPTGGYTHCVGGCACGVHVVLTDGRLHPAEGGVCGLHTELTDGRLHPAEGVVCVVRACALTGELHALRRGCACGLHTYS